MRCGSTVRAAALTLAVLTAGAATAPWAAADGTPGSATSAADAQKLLDDGNFNGAVTAASHLLALSGQAAGGIDKGQVYAIKGEAQLHLKQYALASESYDKAAKAGGDPAVAAVDAATAVLAKRVRNGTYTPRQPGSDGAKIPPVDVLTPDGRKAAFAALFTDELAAAEPKLKAAQTAKTVPQLLAAASLANGLRSLEQVATGSDEKTKAEVTAVAAHAHDLLATALQTAAQRVADIRRAADAVIPDYNNRNLNGQATMPQRPLKVGLTSRNVSELKDIQNTCQQIGPAADAFAKAVAQDAPAAGDGGAGAVAGVAGDWEAVTSQAKQVSSDAQAVLTADYGNTGLPTGPTARGHGR